jgi:hypothetical protein
MLIIRKEQMDVLSNYMLERFVDSASVLLRAAFCDKTKDFTETELRAVIHTGIEKASKYGITIEEDVLRYLEYMLTFGTDFDTNPVTSWARNILRMQNVDSSAKILLLNGYIQTSLKEHI